LFYVRTPYREQSAFPNFDSGVADFNFAQIFSENRFTGQDRIGDANQITAALVSRYIEMDGEERLKLALGQRFYFNTQRVTLDNVNSPSRSDLLLAASGKVSPTLSADAALQLNQSTHQSVQASYGIRWQPEVKNLESVLPPATGYIETARYFGTMADCESLVCRRSQQLFSDG
jgi:LPS-assembly protein